MSYLKEFPDFDTVPAMLDWSGSSTWGDSSWHNDTCPSFISDDLIKDHIVRVWTDYKNPELREYEDGPRYMVSVYSADDERLYNLFAGDSLFLALNIIDHLEAANT